MSGALGFAGQTDYPENWQPPSSEGSCLKNNDKNKTKQK